MGHLPSRRAGVRSTRSAGRGLAIG